MGQGDNNAAPGNAGHDDAGEIDRIMKEIEELEKNMESEENQGPTVEKTVASEAKTTVEEEASTANVVALRPEPAESLVESDAALPLDEPLIREDSSTAGEGTLSLKVGGCAEVTLEFSQAGVAVTLHCDGSGLSIATDQGAEFRIPFSKKVA